MVHCVLWILWPFSFSANNSMKSGHIARFWWPGGYRGGLCEKVPEDSSLPSRASAKMDMSLAKTGTIRNYGNFTVITYLRRKTKNLKKVLHRCNCSQRRAGWKYGGEPTLQTTRSLEKEEKCFGHWSRDSSAALGAAHGEAAVLLQPMEDHWEAEIHLEPVEETHTEAGGCLRETVILWKACVGAASWQGPAEPWREEPTPEQVFW